MVERVRLQKLPPALKHGGYSTTRLLPGEDRTAFEKLHRDLIREFTPDGVLERDIVATMAQLVWRKKHLHTVRNAELAQRRFEEIKDLNSIITFENEINVEAAKEQAREELGDAYALVEMNGAASRSGLIDELELLERLDASIARCLRQLLLARGVKSVSSASSQRQPRLSAPVRAA
jgi:hypothetical protein